MTDSPSTKIPFRDIKDHADLMEFHIRLIRAVVKSETFMWGMDDQITYLKSEIAHFLRIQSAQQGVGVEGVDDVFEHGRERSTTQ